MGQIDTDRIQTNEESNTTISADLSSAINELDSRITSKDIFPVISLTSGLISKIEYFSDVAHTHKLYQREFARTIGSDLISYITGIITTFFNADGSIDSIITTSITRVSDKITSCTNVFSTGEPQC